jgi:probable rRNA maturation factor
MKIEINKGKFNIDKKLVKDAIHKTFQKLEIVGKVDKQRDVEISVAVVGRKKIQEINKQWRRKDEETDVLSFCYENTEEKLEGEVILCLDIIKENAEKDGVETEEELEKNIIHSILHIVGYEHGDEMFNLQEEINKKIK